MYSGEYDVCDVTLSVHHRYLICIQPSTPGKWKSLPDHGFNSQHGHDKPLFSFHRK
jgi:hypothetical protein